ncbi:radical SAM protein [Clostridium sporogenes]|uniref:radical SAM protein n=1 Tax=Clostridium sporogenes TaxID=1509 RepID=UPI0013D4C529|nr:radical SAM protein [Clostridium sporogenes]MBU5299506.1 radical SAM protein [Clostridium sporogenes]
MEFAKYQEYFKKITKGGKLTRFGKPFRTPEHFYFLDTGTGKVLECTEQEYSIFENLMANNGLNIDSLELSKHEIQVALEGVMEAIEKENIFQATPLEKFDGAHMQDLSLAVPQNMQQIILEVTEECNLRCDYCIYNDENDGFRDFGRHNMSWDTAKKAIDYIFKTSLRDEIFIGFYGGEPLLRFDLIKKCVEYALNNKADKDVIFAMTTNGVLMTPDKADFFSSVPQFSLMFSLDGDKETNNEHRKMKNGQGSFDLAFQGYKNALEAYGEEKKHCISISTVVSPPYSTEKFNRMQEFFITSANNLQLNCTYVSHPTKKSVKSAWDEKTKVENRMPLLAWEKQREFEEKEKSFTRAQQNSLFLKIHKRPIIDTPIPWHKFNGCCLPGTRRLYVTTEGKFMACERIGESPIIGDVKNGLDIEAIQKYFVDEYMEKSVPDCKDCWASLLCGICYANCYNESSFDISKKRRLCADERYTVEQALIYYHETLESNPESLEVLNEMEIV